MAKEGSTIPLKMLLFYFHAANTVIVSFLPLYLQFRGLTGTEIGWVMAIGPLISIFSQPFWGYMSDKYQTVKRILMICLIGLLISSTFFLQMATLPLLLTLGATYHFFAAPIGALGDSLAQRRADQLGISFGTIRTWGSIGFAASSLIIGQILEIIGIELMVWPYLVLAVAAFLSSTRLVDVKVETRPVQFNDIGLLMKKKPFLIFLGLIVLITITHRANDSFMGIYIAQLGGSEQLVGFAWFAGVASEAIVYATAGKWFRKFHPLIFIIGAGVLYSIRWFLYASFEDPVLIVALQFLHGLTFGIFYLTAFQYVTRIIPKLLQSTGHLVFVSVFFGISGIIGSLAGGMIMDNFGGDTLYFIMGISSAAGALFILLYHIFPYGKS
ncbi:MFS transporter, PPP family, 3-phenylpropionic acid transporter [Gracilibacillus ureilyticus]|uniref:MFS transporter, PPP family, 3-phenylpropionic acid transporter n=1 Tax=Gracilibacillus ureilyticus TaxID=531814 RepID=A0A1H9MW66_9BACI|nr:MFS transporter [Gracilibacillus ureilyticus]SER27944.1 MFS transporter, PPP family, 3-phenylpropionic acid transporter [Gracilibacillus ureilyticus]